MSAVVEQAIALLVEERDTQERESKRLERLVMECQERLGEAAQRDPQTRAIIALADLAAARLYALRKAVDLVSEHYPV